MSTLAVELEPARSKGPATHRIQWPATRVSSLLGIRYPIIQGPFGGGASTAQLAASVSNAGGLGSFGAYGLHADQITALIGDIRALTPRSFAVNLWVSTHDAPESEMTRERYEAAVEYLRPVYASFGVQAPPYPDQFAVRFEDQVEAVLEARPPAFSFVFGIPDERVLDACRSTGITTIGTASTVAEAVALDEAGVDLIVASGFEAGGHRVSFLQPADQSLIGGIALIPAVADQVQAPVVAAGGIADARGVVAALALGAEGAQIGTAFLATQESGALPEHRAALFDAPRTALTKVVTGRLARGIPNSLTGLFPAGDEILPFPYQGYLLAPVVAAARDQHRADLAKLWCGQSAGLLSCHHADELMDALTTETTELLTAISATSVQHRPGPSLTSLDRWANEGGCLGEDSNYTIVDNPERSRIELRSGRRIAGFVQYERRVGLMALVHTDVAPEFPGHDLAGQLIIAALEGARDDGLEVLPLCPNASGFIGRHPEYLDLVPASQRGHFDLPV